MKRIRTTEVKAHVGERVHVAGWLHSLRQLGGVTFLVLRDGWGMIQAVTEVEARTTETVVTAAEVAGFQARKAHSTATSRQETIQTSMLCLWSTCTSS